MNIDTQVEVAHQQAISKQLTQLSEVKQLITADEHDEEPEITGVHSGDKSPKHQFRIHESIKEVDESSHQEGSDKADLKTINVGGGNGSSSNKTPTKSDKVKLSGSQQEFIRDLIEKLWDNYDTDGSGVLDKIETANFLNEILQAQG